MPNLFPLIELAHELEDAGLVWHPEIGDEISDRGKLDMVSILVDNESMTPDELRGTYIWVPTVEQIISQFEARQAVLLHTGLELSLSSLQYKTVLQVKGSSIESEADSLRRSVGLALRDLLHFGSSVH